MDDTTVVAKEIMGQSQSGMENTDSAFEKSSEEIQAKILGYLSMEDEPILSLMPGSMGRIFNDSILWRDRIKKEFPKVFDKAMELYLDTEGIKDEVNLGYFDRNENNKNNDVIAVKRRGRVFRTCQLLKLLEEAPLGASQSSILETQESFVKDLLKADRGKMSSLSISEEINNKALIRAVAYVLISPDSIIEEFTFYYNNIDLECIKIISWALLRKECTVHKLNISYQGEDDHSQDKIRYMFNIFRAKNNKISDFTFTMPYEFPRLPELMIMLSQLNCKVERLCFDCMPISDHNSASIAQALIHPNCSVVYLKHEYSTNFSDVGAGYYAMALMHPDCTLTELIIECPEEGDDDNIRIGNVGAKSIATALMVTPSSRLEHLKLCDTDIGDVGASSFAELLSKQYCKLKRLVIHSNFTGRINVDGDDNIMDNPLFADLIISDVGAMAIAEALEKNNQSKLEYLRIDGNNITDEGARALANVVVNKRKLGRSLEIKGIGGLEDFVLEIEKAGSESDPKKRSHPDDDQPDSKRMKM
ncbi:MAG: hypothetical protein KKE11_03020 [Gammaproteobacteria bacterium]|nr:hypothetical protein [Gammaproteobacteria bacterium]